MSDELVAETTETEHAHCCPTCMDSWRHTSAECEEQEFVLGYMARRTWAKCPMHEGESE